MAQQQKNNVPNWMLWLVANPFMGFLIVAVFVVGVPAGLAVYLDYRITRLSNHADEVRPPHEPSGAAPGEIPHEIVVGQTVYVPLYSHVYQGSGERLLLAGTLSVRNTDPDRSLTISAVRYYDTEGTMVRDFLKTPLKVKPMGSTDFLVKESDTSGGSGANFIVEWVSDEPVHEPIVEAVMVGRRGGSVTAFVRPGVVTKQIRLQEPRPP